MPVPYRILQLAETMQHGVGRHVTLLAGGLRAHGHQITLGYAGARADPAFLAALDQSGVARRDLAMRRAIGPWDITAMSRLRRLWRDEGPFDLIHAHSSKAGAIARLGLKGRAPICYSPHAFKTLDPALGMVGRSMLRTAESWMGRHWTDRLIATSEAEKSHAEGLGINAAKIAMVYNGVPEIRFIERAEARARLGIDPSRLLLCFANRWVAQKAPERFLDVVDAAHARDPRFAGLIISMGDVEQDGHLGPRVEAMRAAGRLWLQRGSPADWLGAADIYLLTSHYEGMPHILVEAGQARLALVASDVGGAAEMIDDGVNGYRLGYAEPDSAFVDRLMRLAADPDRLAAMQTASHGKAMQFSPERMVGELLEEYGMLIRAHRDSQPVSERRNLIVTKAE